MGLDISPFLNHNSSPNQPKGETPIQSLPMLFFYTTTWISQFFCRSNPFSLIHETRIPMLSILPHPHFKSSNVSNSKFSCYFFLGHPLESHIYCLFLRIETVRTENLPFLGQYNHLKVFIGHKWYFMKAFSHSSPKLISPQIEKEPLIGPSLLF